MGWSYMKAKDAISGTEGTLYATIDGEVIAIAECKSFSAKITKQKKEFKALGYRGVQHKTTGWSGTGEMVLYFASSRFVKMMINYAKTGKDEYFKLQATNEDPTSSIGRQTVTIMEVNLDEADIAKLNTESEFLEQAMSFTYSDVDMPDEFTAINAG